MSIAVSSRSIVIGTDHSSSIEAVKLQRYREVSWQSEVEISRAIKYILDAGT